MKTILNKLAAMSGKSFVPRSAQECGITFYIDSATKFYRSILFKGWFSHHSGNKPIIKNIAAESKNISAFTWQYVSDMPHLGKHAGGFEIQLLLVDNSFPEDVKLIFEIDGIGLMSIKWNDIRNRVKTQTNKVSLAEQFRELLESSQATEMLDIGGRARSGVLRATHYPKLKTEVLDILPGDGVTIVSDAHSMSKVINHERFDAVLSISVFEHLVMPWKVAVEMNRVMKKGAIALIATHQTIGMHDMPWDFFRFSDSAWNGIFNSHTGFEILGTELDSPNYIVPFFWETRYRDAEKSAGFEHSAVLIRKISDPSIDWPLSAKDVTMDLYPEGEEEAPDNYRET